MPTTVVPGFLYLGSYDTASRQELLKAMQISDILNVSRVLQLPLCGAHARPARMRACAFAARFTCGGPHGTRCLPCSAHRSARHHTGCALQAPLTCGLLPAVLHLSVALDMQPSPHRPCPQTVPSCAPLFKNTFNYHTVSVAPPEFDECFGFLGAPHCNHPGQRPAPPAAACGRDCMCCHRVALHAAGNLTMHATRAQIGPADKVNSENKRVLVYCMTGVSRCGSALRASAAARGPAAAQRWGAAQAASCGRSPPCRRAPPLRGGPPKLPASCAARAPRAPTIAIGYLMKLHRWRLAEAYKWVKDKRPSVNISQGETPPAQTRTRDPPAWHARLGAQPRLTPALPSSPRRGFCHAQPAGPPPALLSPCLGPCAAGYTQATPSG